MVKGIKNLIKTLREWPKTINELDEAMTEVRKVSNMSVKELIEETDKIIENNKFFDEILDGVEDVSDRLEMDKPLIALEYWWMENIGYCPIMCYYDGNEVQEDTYINHLENDEIIAVLMIPRENKEEAIVRFIKDEEECLIKC